MRRWKVQDPSGEYVVTEAEILATYYQYWAAQMVKVGKASLVTPAACIEDWVVIHWAWEIDPT